MIDEKRLQGWVPGAVAGSRLTLGRGHALPPGLSGEVRRLTDAGAVVPVRRREGDGAFLFQVERMSGVVPVAGSRAGAVIDRGSQRDAVLRAIRAAIRAGRPCPTNAELARDCDVAGGRVAVAYHIRRLVQAGAVQFDHFGPLERRVAIDPVTAKRTPRGPVPSESARARRVPGRRALAMGGGAAW